MESEEGTGPVESAPEPAPIDAAPEAAPVEHAVVAAATTSTPRQTGPSGPAIFGGLVAVLLLSVGASALLLAGAGRTPSVEPVTISTVQTAAPAETLVAATGTPSDRVRVVSASGRSTATGGGSYQVTFTWSLQGARENDQAVIHFFAGNQFLGEQRGMLDQSVFSFSSGTLTLATEQKCSGSGWSAEIVTIRGAPIDGDGIATIPGVQCP